MERKIEFYFKTISTKRRKRMGIPRVRWQWLPGFPQQVVLLFVHAYHWDIELNTGFSSKSRSV